MPWYIPILSAVIGAIISGFCAWKLRAAYDRRAERRSDFQRVLDSYLALTDGENEKQDVFFRLWALQRAGALRLSQEEFELLLGDVKAHGRGVRGDSDPVIVLLGIRKCLIFAAYTGVDPKDPKGFSDGMLKILQNSQDKNLFVGSVEAEKMLKALRNQ